ncbi:hypothetical protein L4174_023855 (plasmid) [Photobacterium sp. CCB-ST2H9]|uniref:hypothetical protein n=1 Tax=Photobacterium sp. CCB-ST2H9 TaxID=2912855 RepID=UPI002006D925|nr:hypothetical protein [Photobacterium sp. CCB-ST2H9]UTM60422.1 hypothetical protein L4174_023855 [Photobacterium sp. CCB-ST2H9]
MYGITQKHQVLEIAIAVCEVIGTATNDTVSMLVETCAAETLLGEYRDPTQYGAGTGLMQVDEGTFIWLQEKYGNHKFAHAVQDRFGVSILKVEYRELEHSPLLSMIWARLRYATRKEPIPSTLQLRAEYWKMFYNTEAGKGSVGEYMKKVQHSGCLRMLEKFYSHTS